MKLMGKTVTDKITGFAGVAIGYVQYISGCSQYLVAPKVNAEGKRQDGEWFDEQRLIADETKETITLDNGTTPGCDQQAPQR